MESLIGIAAIFLFVFVNGFFVAAEFAFVGARRTRIAQLAAEGNVNAIAAEQAIGHLDNYIAATQLGITLASLALGWLGEPAIAHLFEPLLGSILPGSAAETLSRTISVVIAFSLVTTLHIVFGELAPKAIALQRPEATALVVARPTIWFYLLFRPIIKMMNAIGNAVVRALGFEPAGEHAHVHSAEELEMLVHSSTEAGILQQSEEQLLRRIFDFGDIHVEEIMQPRVDIDAFPTRVSIPELVKQVREQHHTRYPVYKEGIDRVVGILHTKDLFGVLVMNPALLVQEELFDLSAITRKPLFVPESSSLDKVMDLMRRSKTHLVIVEDEYGGTAGIVTLEDILEQIVGDVQDEFDIDEDIQTDGSDILMDGSMSMNEFIDLYGDPDREYESITIGGYIAETLDRIPVVGDAIKFGNYTLRVAVMDGLRVERVTVMSIEGG
ncbi:MAG: HlyC/CorC family transporter [Anaerolineae bacterium]|nr:HlyC/CorC family transporter [Anaerolineae bacterium]